MTGPVRTFHPTTFALVVAAARLAEGHLAAQRAMRDERLLARNLPHLVGLRGTPGALLTPGGRVLAEHPVGWLGTERVALPAAGDRVALGEDAECVVEPLAEGWLLRLSEGGGRARPVVLALTFLGARRPTAHVDGRPLLLSTRHAELLVLLTLHPEGCSADELAAAIYGDAANPVTVRAEIHRLRVALGARVLRAHPYRLQAEVEADFLRVRSALVGGRARDAALAYAGPLLPRSDAPAVREEREQLHIALRYAALASNDVSALWALTSTSDGADDVELAERLVVLLPDTDPRRAVVVARLSRSG